MPTKTGRAVVVVSPSAAEPPDLEPSRVVVAAAADVGTGPRPRRIRIPFFCDVVLVDDRQQIAFLNAHPAVSRDVRPDGGLLNRVIADRILGTLVVGAEPLPVF